MAQDQLKACLNLMRRMPPAQTETSLAGLCNLVPDLTDELLGRVDQPLKTAEDTEAARKFIQSDYNRDGDSYRSPWTNKYYPPIEDGFLASERVRKLEIEANHLFDIYRKLYFSNGYSSVYFWDLTGESFAACWLIQKDVGSERGLAGGSWNSIHVFEVVPSGSNWTYKLTTTVLVSMAVDNQEVGGVDLSGSMTKQMQKVNQPLSVGKGHVQIMGSMVEEIELKVRQAIEGIYIQKTREVINGMRNANGPKRAKLADFTMQLGAAIGAHGKKMGRT